MGLRAHGKGHLRGLQPGSTLTLAGYPQTKANRDYVVLTCELEMTEVGTSSGSWRQYAVNTTFELQPDTEYYRLPQVTPRPHVDDEYAVIVSPEHHPNQHYETWIDDKNRVRIQYDWDREARYDGATSIWVRVASQWQGGQMGVVAPGRAGQMVIVSHVHGDPDRPYVSGFVVDRWNMPPWELPRNDALINRAHCLHSQNVKVTPVERSRSLPIRSIMRPDIASNTSGSLRWCSSVLQTSRTRQTLHSGQSRSTRTTRP